ncbi:fructose-bisphosphate aldolase, class II [Enterococcus sp. AZ135]|uniref:ketose-bisphosphate aldolase n=1 Tax=unclassified Enterococcus TaxID=2608891 RepID=UPI003F26126D
MLINMKDLLAVARENKFAVPAFNICNYDMAKVIIEAAEETDSPVILEVHPIELEYVGNSFIEALKDLALCSKVPVVIHLDHGGSVEDVMKAIRNGYTSVMIDASHESFEDNMTITKEVVALAHSVGVSVEAEIGTIGDNGSAEGGSSEIIYTDPDLAKQFVSETGIDTLAIAIGTAHGLYPKDFVPKLNIELLQILYSQLDIPFVLHGGSGNPDTEVSESVKYGVAKVNISSDIKSVFFKATKEVLEKDTSLLEPHQVFVEPKKAVKEVVLHKMSILNCLGQAKNY